ncbi:hypothetical protein ACHAQF_008407 [Verticillium nonalfalfae]
MASSFSIHCFWTSPSPWDTLNSCTKHSQDIRDSFSRSTSMLKTKELAKDGIIGSWPS